MRGWVGAAIGLAMLGAAAGASAQMADSYKFLKAVTDRDGNEVTAMLAKPNAAVVNARENGTGDGALHIVTKRRDLAWLQFLLGKGLRPDIRDRAGETPLGLAARLGFLDGARVLLAARAPVDAPNARGETPLIVATQARNTEMVRLLLGAGADPDLGDRVAGLSARDYAKQDRRAATVLRLIETTKRPAAAKKAQGPGL